MRGALLRSGVQRTSAQGACRAQGTSYDNDEYLLPGMSIPEKLRIQSGQLAAAFVKGAFYQPTLFAPHPGLSLSLSLSRWQSLALKAAWLTHCSSSNPPFLPTSLPPLQPPHTGGGIVCAGHARGAVKQGQASKGRQLPRHCFLLLQRDSADSTHKTHLDATIA